MAKILIADDDKVMRGLLSTLMELEGDEAITVTRPEEVVPMAEDIKPDLILMDYHLAGGDSINALRELRKHPTLSKTPILVTSGMDRKLKAMQEGATDFIMKPFRPADLLEVMHRMIENKT